MEIFSPKRKKRNRDDVVLLLLIILSHVCRVYDYVRCFLTPGNIAATDSNDAPPHQAMHQRRYIVRLTSRHFKGYNFPPTRTKYVIAIRARNTFLLHHRRLHHHHDCQHRRLRLCSSPSLYGPQRAARVLREISFSCYGHRGDCQRILQPEGI